MKGLTFFFAASILWLGFNTIMVGVQWVSLYEWPYICLRVKHIGYYPQFEEEFFVFDTLG